PEAGLQGVGGGAGTAAGRPDPRAGDGAAGPRACAGALRPGAHRPPDGGAVVRHGAAGAMRVLLITQTLDRQDSILGATHGLAEQLARRLERLYALQLWAGETALRSMGKERGATKPAQLATLTRAVRTLAARGQVDLVFAHMAPLYAIVAAPIARLSGVPTVLWYAHPHVDLKLRLATALVDRVASPTPEGFRVPTAKLTLTGHGVDTERFLPPRTPCQGPLRVLYAGRISRSKDVATFLRAARLALDQSPAGALRFAIIGRPG